MTIASALLKMPLNRHVVFHILDGGLSEDNRCHLESLVLQIHQNSILNFHDVLEVLPHGATPGPGNSIIAYGRIWMGSLLAKVDKVIYLDSDTLVLGDLSILWNIDLQEYSTFACLDIKIDSLGDDTAGFLSENEKSLPYFNSGVLLVDLSKWRKIQIERLALDLIADPNCTYRWHDQTILNYLLRGTIGVMPAEWNWIARDFPVGDTFEVNLIHYTNSTKPWNYWGNELRFQLWRECYRVVFGSPLRMFLSSGAYKGLACGLFDSALENFLPLRWIYLGYLKKIYTFSRSSDQKITLDKKIRFLGRDKDQQTKAKQKIFLKRFRKELQRSVVN
jgi:lipopolysaccharide biosynthesis glycosyltransferase